MTLGQRIRNRRTELGTTQSSLARALGVTPQHISAIEQDKRAPSLDSLVGIAETLGVSTDYLLTGKEGVVSEAIPAIKADSKLSLKSKRAIIALIEEYHSLS